MSWITTDLKPSSNRIIDRLGNQYRIANGYLGYRGTLEEYTKDQKTATSISELTDKCVDQRCEMVNIPNGGYIQAVVNGVPLHVLSGRVLAHAQALHIDHDIHFRRTVFSMGDGAMILVRARRFASLAYPHLLCMEYMLQSSQECAIILRTGIDGDVWESNGPHLENYHTYSQAGVLSLTAQTRAQAIPVAVSECSLLENGNSISIQEEKRIFQEIEVGVGRYQPVVLTKFAAVYTGIDSRDPLTEGKNLCDKAAQIGFETLYQGHCALWEERWRDQRLMRRAGAPGFQSSDLAFFQDVG